MKNEPNDFTSHRNHLRARLLIFWFMFSSCVFSLVIVSVDPDRDYGTYSCHATNFLGTSVGYINLSGKLHIYNLMDVALDRASWSMKSVVTVCYKTDMVGNML